MGVWLAMHYVPACRFYVDFISISIVISYFIIVSLDGAVMVYLLCRSLLLNNFFIL